VITRALSWLRAASASDVRGEAHVIVGVGRIRCATGGFRRVPVFMAALLVTACGPGPQVDPVVFADVEVPAEHGEGRNLFDAHCIECHGAMGLGTEQGPPLVHTVYRPLHHGDEAFQIAVSRGVRAHHWRFGDMPAIPGLTRADVEAVVGYVRWLQRTAGIE
jgi:mono/diheme cytochrome c family protein